MLTEGAVRAADKRAQFVGIDAYVAAGGVIMRDLFQGDDGGWLQDVGAARPAGRRKARDATPRRSAPKAGSGSRSRPTSPTATPMVCASFAASRCRSPRRSKPLATPFRPNATASRQPMPEADELPEEVDQRAWRNRDGARRFRRSSGPLFDPGDIARAGAFVSIDGSGNLRIERGFVRPEDELPIEPRPERRRRTGHRPEQPPRALSTTA